MTMNLWEVVNVGGVHDGSETWNCENVRQAQLYIYPGQ